MFKHATTIGGVIAAAALSTAVTTANAYEGGDFILRAGWAEVSPNESTGNITADGTDLVPGKDVIDVSNGSALGISGTYMFNSVLGLELLAATPFEHDIKASGDLADTLNSLGVSTDIGTTKQLPPTLSVQYYPMGHSHADSAWQPYIGAGLNFTWFFDEELEGPFTDASGARSKDFSLSNSWGLAAMAGIDWLFADNWLLNASLMYAQIATEAEITNTAFGDLKVDVDVDPWVYRINLGYRF